MGIFDNIFGSSKPKRKRRRATSKQEIHRGVVHEGNVRNKSEVKRYFEKQVPGSRVKKVTRARGGGYAVYWVLK
jgi:hypothetical protein